MRLDQYTAHFWPEHSRSTWQKFIKMGAVTVNGEVITRTKYELNEDDQVAVDPPAEPDFSSMSIPILYEDDNVIVVNKPAGILTHAKGALSEEFTVADFFKAYTSYNADTNRPGIIHRLDRDTSGVLLGVKNDATAKSLARQFADRKVKKTYMAVLDGIPAEPEAVIDIPIGRNPSAPSTFKAHIDGKNAETAYHIEKYGTTRCLAKLMPKTGRTHQLRVHMAYLNTPIRGDRVYGKPASRLFLHAYKLEITVPKGKRKTFEAPVPAEFESELD